MSVLAFGPFAVDLRTSVLSRNGAPTALSPKLVQVLACLAEARGELVTRDLLFERFWPGVTVTDNTLTRAIADIRKALDDNSGQPIYIQTSARRGYRFVAAVQEAGPDADPAPVPAGLAGLEPFVAWERGRTALESLRVPALPVAIAAFQRAVSASPHYAAAHAGLANAHIFLFESTRLDNTPNLPALAAAELAARRATDLDPAAGEGWAALGHSLAAGGHGEAARAALARAIGLEPRNWRHHYRLAAATWGEERLRSVERAEALLPGFPGAATLTVMVLVARQAFDLAAAAAARGADAQAAQSGGTRYPASGLLWLRGLAAAARGDVAAATADFAGEVSFSSASGTVYARECQVLAEEALGFLRLTAGDGDAARRAFQRAELAAPGHARAVLGLAVADGAVDPIEAVAHVCDDLAAAGKHGERALVLAAADAWAGRTEAALARAESAIAGPADSTGWSLPADPMFAPLRVAAGYSRLIARLAARAA